MFILWKIAAKSFKNTPFFWMHVKRGEMTKIINIITIQELFTKKIILLEVLPNAQRVGSILYVKIIL